MGRFEIARGVNSKERPIKVSLGKLCFVVKFCPDGYYAERQPRYEWSFTKDIKKAKIYKTRKGASALINRWKSVSEDTLWVAYQSSAVIFELDFNGTCTKVQVVDTRPNRIKKVEQEAIPPRKLDKLLEDYLKKYV